MTAKQELKEAHGTIAMQAEQLADLRGELRSAEVRIEELHSVIDRKNAIILMMAMGDNPE